jgi:L,D-peptidoglycan transpeptidase YkuD (ErfK/YbiS/YcfS/YnhG family)
MLAIACLACPAPAAAAGTSAAGSRFSIPATARQLIVVSSPTYDPPGYLASFRTFERASASLPWRPVFGAWHAEIGSGELRDVRREGDHATPTGVYPLGSTIFGNEPNPGGLHEVYHHLLCGDWWDEDPYSVLYNRFVHVNCDSTPAFAEWSEALWTETRAYPYFAVIDYNEDPTISGSVAPGAGIFLHAWMGEPTEGCVALPIPDLLHVLRWFQPADHPVIEIGTDAEVGRVPPGEPRPKATFQPSLGFSAAIFGIGTLPEWNLTLTGATA